MITELPQWQSLITHQHEMSKIHLRDLLQAEQTRFQQFSVNSCDLLLDYSKNHINAKTMILLQELAHAVKLAEQIAAIFTGKNVNFTENRAALHMAFRQPKEASIMVEGKNIIPLIQQSLEKIAVFSEQIRTQQWRGHNNDVITDIVNIGIGGSDLGPQLAIEALQFYQDTKLKIHFINNVDPISLKKLLSKLYPATTLFIISSKSFRTIETLKNAEAAIQWFHQTSDKAEKKKQHFIAITHHINKARELGIAEQNIFWIPEWVGGRFSIWSAIGLPLALSIGMENFRQFLQGGYLMDEHFRTTPFKRNMPVILGLLDIWYNNFFKFTSRAVLPYSDLLKKLPAYLQQAEMESLGKQVNAQGQLINYSTGQIIFGDVGTNAQHAFMQLIHQGTVIIPVDFIIPIKNISADNTHQKILIANALSQSKALAEGRIDQNPHKTLPGNRPSNTLLIPEQNPFYLGALLALYEHKIFVQSIIWQINAFDQWGVEFGKQLALDIFDNLNKKDISDYDCSTNGLIDYSKKYF